MLTNWIGDHGFLHTLDVSVRKPNLVGDTLWWAGSRFESHVQGYGIVELTVRAKNQKGALWRMAPLRSCSLLETRGKSAFLCPS